MAFTLCVDSQHNFMHASISYDIQTMSQAIIFASYAIICLIIEIIFFILTLRFFCGDNKLKSNIYAIIFYLSFHLSLITTALYFTGGIICYGISLYNFLSSASYILQGAGVYFVILNMLDSLIPLLNPDSRWNTCWLIPGFFLYIIGFTVLYLMEVRQNQINSLHLFNSCGSLIVAIGFLIVAKRLCAELIEKYPSILPPDKQRIWNSVVLTITGLMIMRSICAFCDFLGLALYLKQNNIAIFTIYAISLSLLFDIFPCVVLLFFIKIQTRNDIHSKSIGEIRSTLGIKSPNFTKERSDTLMEQMVGDENAKEDDGL